MNVQTFTLTAAVMHDIPRGGDGEQPRLTDAPIALDDGLRRYFVKKTRDSLEARGVEVVPDPHSDSPVVEHVAAIAADSGQLIADSQAIAMALHEAQTGRNSAGLLTVLLGTVDGQPAICVMKLEREQGVRFNIDTDEAGNHVVDLELLRELTLTDRTKVFKTALFVAGDPTDSSTVIGRVSDDQRGRHEGTGVASFYLGDFLGCQLRHSPAKQTLEFFDAAQKFVNDAVADPETQGRYQVALLSEIQGNDLDIKPLAFAQRHIDPAHQPAFKAALTDAGLDPKLPITKDATHVKVNRLRVDFKHGIYLVGSPSEIEKRVTFPADGAADQRTHVDDAVKRMGGR